MNILKEMPFHKTLCPGDTLRLEYTETDGVTTTTTRVGEYAIEEALECTRAAIIELKNEAGFERALGGVFGRKRHAV